MTQAMQKLVVLFLSLIFLLTVNGQSFAVTTPTFPECSNPQGTIKVQYTYGTHGIAGDPSNYQGSDTVYTITDTTQVQCFCTQDEKGIQTNWWKVTSLTDDEIKILKNQGWIYIPNGLLWGLDDAPYMAKNSDYSCRIPSVGSIETQNSGPSVLGLADTGSLTGNIFVSYILIIIGIISLLLYLMHPQRIRD